MYHAIVQVHIVARPALFRTEANFACTDTMFVPNYFPRVARTAIVRSIDSFLRESEANARHADYGAQLCDHGVFGVDVGAPFHQVRDAHGDSPVVGEGEWQTLQKYFLEFAFGSSCLMKSPDGGSKNIHAYDEEHNTQSKTNRYSLRGD